MTTRPRPAEPIARREALHSCRSARCRVRCSQAPQPPVRTGRAGRRASGDLVDDAASGVAFGDQVWSPSASSAFSSSRKEAEEASRHHRGRGRDRACVAGVVGQHLQGRVDRSDIALEDGGRLAKLGGLQTFQHGRGCGTIGGSTVACPAPSGSAAMLQRRQRMLQLAAGCRRRIEGR